MSPRFSNITTVPLQLGAIHAPIILPPCIPPSRWKRRTIIFPQTGHIGTESVFAVARSGPVSFTFMIASSNNGRQIIFRIVFTGLDMHERQTCAKE